MILEDLTLEEIAEPSRCIECRSNISNGAKICTVCNSRQDWRRHLALSNTTLGLLVALFSVLAVFIDQLVPFWQQLTDRDRPKVFAKITKVSTGGLQVFLHNGGDGPAFLEDVIQCQVFLSEAPQKLEDVLLEGVIHPTNSEVQSRFELFYTSVDPEVQISILEGTSRSQIFVARSNIELNFSYNEGEENEIRRSYCFLGYFDINGERRVVAADLGSLHAFTDLVKDQN